MSHKYPRSSPPPDSTIVSFDGLIATREGAIDDTIAAALEQIASLNSRIEVRQSILQKQFTAMETAVAQFNSLGSFLGSQLAATTATTK